MTIQVLQAENLRHLEWLRHGFSTRRGGVSQAYGGGTLNLGFTKEDTREAVEQNRELFLKAIGAGDTARISGSAPEVVDPGYKAWPLVAMRQIHSSLIHTVDGTPHEPLRGDGLITNRNGLVLAVRTADCLPVLIVDPVHRAIGAFHAGWRGTLARIVEKGVGEMRRQFGSDPAKLLAAIGPGIHRCCYEVDDELRDQFVSQFRYAAELFEEVSSGDEVHRKYPLLFMNMRAPGHGEPPHKAHLDLVEASRRQLQDAGVENIWISEMCTACRTDLFFSHRREKGVTGRMMSAVGMTNEEMKN